MTLIRTIDDRLKRLLRDKSDTPKTLEQKVYFLRNFIIPVVIISLAFLFIVILKQFQLLLLISPCLWSLIISAILLIIIKRGIKWFIYLTYGSYIIICCYIVLKLGGLPNSFGVWGGAFICFLIALGLKDKKLLVINAMIYGACLLIIVLSYPYLSPFKQWNLRINNLFFTFNEIWMCLHLVKAFYDGIILKTNEAKNRAVHLQELDLLKSKLYANIAHEFRTPLTLIRGNAEEIEEHHGGEASEMANSIIQNSNKILFLVNQMLNLSKIEEGGVPMHYIQCDLVAFVRFVTGSFQGYADMRKIGLHYNAECRQLMMDIEAEKLEESLSNLLSNAIKYTPEGGDVYVSVRLLNPAESSEQQVEISVRDTGIGIPEDQLDKIFIRFYRVEDKRFAYREGTGIGLTLVKEYLKLMKGSIQVSSSQGKGSEFVIVLPVTQNAKVEEVVPVKKTYTQKEEISTSESGPIQRVSNRPQLLIIEDNAELREYLTCLLAGEYQVLTAEDGIQGVEQAIEHIPDIILSDIMMPGKDGYQVCRELKNDFRTNHIPIVLLTARADTDSRIRGFEQGADVYLTKPFNKKELIVCLHNLFLQRETLRLKFSSNLFDKKADEKEAGLNEKFLSRVIMFLEKNYKNDRYGIHHLYSDMKISRMQLHRKLIAITGLSASNFMRSFRLQKARKLLLETDRNVSDIAFEVGITDPNYFSKAFIHEYGITPSDMRKSFI